METKNIPIGKLELNSGQIEGLPKNPRFIRDERFKALKKSIQDFPEMMEYRELIVYPVGGKYVVIGGNMRLRACKELGYKDVPAKILPENTPVEKLREFAIKDNIAFGQLSWDDLANEWEQTELEEWGIELQFLSEDVDIDRFFKDDENDRTVKKGKIILEYTEDECGRVMDELAKIAKTPEQAVWKLLKFE